MTNWNDLKKNILSLSQADWNEINKKIETVNNTSDLPIQTTESEKPTKKTCKINSRKSSRRLTIN